MKHLLKVSNRLHYCMVTNMVGPSLKKINKRFTHLFIDSVVEYSFQLARKDSVNLQFSLCTIFVPAKEFKGTVP
jgi:hypothetical protein